MRVRIYLLLHSILGDRRLAVLRSLQHGVPKWMSTEKLAGWVKTGEGKLRVPKLVRTEYQKRETDLLNLMTTARSTVVRGEYYCRVSKH